MRMATSKGIQRIMNDCVLQTKSVKKKKKNIWGGCREGEYKYLFILRISFVKKIKNLFALAGSLHFKH